MPWVPMPIQQEWQDENGDAANGFVLKAYLPGTTTATSIAINKNGGSPQSTITLNSQGHYEVSGNEVIPHIDQEFKYAIFRNASDAAANSNPYFGFIDNVTLASISDDFTVDSYATLRGKTSSIYADGNAITVTDDGIAGQFVVKTGTVTDNGGTLIVFTDDSNRYVERLYVTAINVKWFGALGDGVTDDAAALDTALAAAETLSIDSVFFPSGTYLTTASLTLRTGVTVRGVGSQSIILIGGNNTRALKGDILEGIIIEKLFFDGQKPTVGWETTNNFDFGIRLGENATSRSIKNVVIRNCTFKDIGLDGIYIENYSNVKIAECDFINCRRWGIVPQAEAHDGMYCSIEDCWFDCDFGGGPVGKEYPLGAIDSEPNSGELTTITFKNIRGKRNGVYMVGSGTYTYDAVIENVSVLGDFLYISNRVDVNVRNSTVRGTAGYLLVDTLNDSVPTKINSMDLRFLDTGRNQAVLSDGRRNLMPYDHGFEDYWNGSLSASGSGTSAGLVLREIDGQAVYLRDHQLGATSGSYSTIRQTLSNTLNNNDQVVLILEVERTDSNTATGNFLSVSVGANFSRALQVDAGVSTLMFAWQATATEASPFVSIGLSGTAGAQVNVLFRKIKLFFNPTEITKDTFRTVVRPYRKTELTFSGPTVDAANTSQISFSAASGQNIDTITSGYNGQVLSLYGASAGIAFTVRDASVSSGNIELIGNGTYVLQNGTSTNALTLIYDSGTSTWIQAS